MEFLLNLKRKNKKKNNNNVPAKSYILAGIFLLLIASGYKIYDKISTPTPQQISQDESLKLPLKISIPNIGLDYAPITKGGIVNDKWILSDTHLLYLPTSGLPGEGFNTIIYGHNSAQLLKNLINIKLKDKIIVENRENKKFEYEVYNFEYANPYDVAKIKSQESNSLTLFTCQGFFDEYRQIVKAKLIKTF